MKNKNLKTLTLLCLSTIMSCSQNNNSIEKKEEVKQKQKRVKKNLTDMVGGTALII